MRWKKKMFTWKISELHFDLTKFPGYSEPKSWANDETFLCYQISQLKMVFFSTGTGKTRMFVHESVKFDINRMEINSRSFGE